MNLLHQLWYHDYFRAHVRTAVWGWVRVVWFYLVQWALIALR